MITPHIHKKAIERVSEVYVAVFPVPVNGNLSTEVILAGYQQHPDYPDRAQVRATVETNESAVEDLVTLCDRIVDGQKEIESYRLLKFDKDGIHVLQPDDYRRFDHEYTGSFWGCC